jgi:hypothetical protein
MHSNAVAAQRANIDGAVRQPFRQAQGPEPVEGLLEEVRRRFYAGQPVRDFHRDRRMLLYALTWPAAWLEGRALTCPAARYHALLAERLVDIAVHGDPARYGAYFPAYLLKCLQDWFQHHGEGLYDELKHIRNALDQVLASARFAARVQRDAQHTEILAATHRLLQAHRAQREKPDGRQLSLF